MAKKKSLKKSQTIAPTGNKAEAGASAGRIFLFDGIVLSDPGTDKSVEDVKDFYSTLYPELVNADVKGPDREGAVEKWTFVKKLAPKG